MIAAAAIGAAAGQSEPPRLRASAKPVAPSRPGASARDGEVLFRDRVAPVLATQCMRCHGTSAPTGGLDLRSRAGLMRGSQRGSVVVPGKPEQSRLLQMVAAGKMPPGKPLRKADVSAIRAWIAAGAPWPDRASAQTVWWAFRPLRRPTIPRVRNPAWVRNPVDAFILHRLEREGLHPSPPADRRTLIRRVTFDLTGLPPTPEEVAAFLGDRSPDAYEKIVDRLLASPHYGEGWARHWLDVVRYGESHGYEQNHLRPNAWPYRDYVIRALNQDLPFERFVAEQLAGDVLDPGNPDVEAATGYLVAGTHDTVGNQTEAGSRQQRADDLDDMVSTTGAAFLGLTVNCARCHDHKFDPIPQRDYYRLQAVFAGVQHGERPLASPDRVAERNRRLEGLNARLREVEAALKTLEGQALAAATQARSADGLRPPVNTRRNEERFPPVGARFVRFVITATADGAEPCLDELEVYGETGEENLALSRGGARATASSLLPGYPIHRIPHLNDGRYGNDFSWISNEPGAGIAVIELAQEAPIARVIWGRDRDGRFQDRLATRYRVEVSRDGRTWQMVSGSDDRRAGSTRPLGEAELARLLSPEQAKQRDQLLAERAQVRQEIAAVPAVAMAYAGIFRQPEPAYLLLGGDPMKRGEQVAPGALSVVGGDPGIPADAPEGERRLALARWITRTDNPLPWRVMVNRVWQHHFGRGIVATPSDFGSIGEKPTHPELLDWLASEFQSSGGHLKPLHRLISLSNAYRQSSRMDSHAYRVDRDARLLWRMPPRRLDAEQIRDAILAVSGKLDRSMGGPSFRLYVYRVDNVALYDPVTEFGLETFRRAIYQQAARSIASDLLGAFDCPDSSLPAPRRASTTTAPQALTLLNGLFVNQQAGFFAERIGRAAATVPDQVGRAFLLAFGRKPAPDERAAAVVLANEHGLAALCRALFNANEFLYY